MSGKKPKSCVWKYYTINNENKGVCNFCNISISMTAARFKHHILRACLKAPQDVKSIIITENNSKLKQQNNKLLSRVLYQEKCIQLLENYRNYFILFCNTCKCNLNIGNNLILNELENDYKLTFDEKRGKRVKTYSNINFDVNNDSVNNREEVVNTINSDNNVNHLMTQFNENRDQLNSNTEKITISLADIKTEDNMDLGSNDLEENALDFNNSVISDEEFCNNSQNNEKFVFGSNIFNDKRKAKNDRNKYEFKCEFEDCGKPFKSKLGYESHINRDHNNVKPFKCNTNNCDKSFFTKNALQRHLARIHAKNKKRYKCDHKKCERMFVNKSELFLHLKTHSKEKPYVCDWNECKAKYKCLTSLKYHKLKHQDMNHE